MTVDQALSLTAVYRSVQILETFCAQLPIDIYRNGEIPDATALNIQKPDADRSLASWIKRTVNGLALNGNAYWYLTRDSKGRVVDIKVLNPLSVTVRFSDSGTKFYDVSTNGKTNTYTDRDIQHLRLMEVPGHDYGLGPIQAGRAGLYNARDIRDYARNWFANGGSVPRGVLKTDQKLVDGAYERTVDGWNEGLKYNDAVVILEQGLDYKPVVLSPADAMWLDAQKFTKVEIGTLFGIPPTFISAEIDSSEFTYSNLSQINTVFYQSALMVYLGEIENALTQVLPNGQVAKFNTDDLLRTDEKTRAEVDKINADKWAVLLAAGVVSPQYVASELGLPTPPKPKPAPAPAPAVEPNPSPVEDPAA